MTNATSTIITPDFLKRPLRLRDITFENRPNRPLGALSDYVREKLPANQPNLAEAILLLPGRGQIRSLLKEEASIALLDLKMLFVAASVHQTPPAIREQFGEAVEMTNEILGRPPVRQMSYQEIILDNPPKDMRVFTQGNVGKAEAKFYRGHQLIEDALAVAIEAMQRAVSEPRHALAALDLALVACKHVAGAMRSFMTDMEREDFLAFKPFFNTNPYTGEKGPSGAFTAKIPQIDILLYGPETPAETLRYLNENQVYFPQMDHYEAMRFSVDAPGIMNVFEGEAKAKAAEIANTMLIFRSFHFGAVTKQIGADVVGGAEGKEAVSFLTNRTDGFRALLQQHKPNL